MKLSDQILKRILEVTSPDKEVVREARRRLNTVFDASETIPGVLGTIRSGSLAHYTVSGAVNDADGALVLDRRHYKEYGPDSEEKKGPEELVTTVADSIRQEVKDVYPDVYISTGHKRAIYFRFRQSILEQDPTVDLIIALRRKDRAGIWIPNLDTNTWDASDPGRHTQMMSERRQATDHKSSKWIRLCKLFSGQWSAKLLHSFNWSALMLESSFAPSALTEDWAMLLEHTEQSIARGNTPDPAGVSEPIKLPEGRSKQEVVAELKDASEKLRLLADIEGEEATDIDKIKELFRGLFRYGEVRSALDKAVEEVEEDLRKTLDAQISRATSLGASPIVLPALNSRPITNTRAYAIKESVPAGNIKDLRGLLQPVVYDLQRFEGGLNDSDYWILSSKHSLPYHLAYVVSMPVVSYSENILVSIEIRGLYSTIQAHGLKNLRHVYGDGALCLWHPRDPVERQWRCDKGLVSLLDIVNLHLYKELRFQQTGIWVGDEEH